MKQIINWVVNSKANSNLMGVVKEFITSGADITMVSNVLINMNTGRNRKQINMLFTAETLTVA